MAFVYGGDPQGFAGTSVGVPGAFPYDGDAPGLSGLLYDTEGRTTTGFLHYGRAGLGVLGSAIRSGTSTGPHGSGYLYNDWQGPSDDPVEMRGLVITPPASGVFVAQEDGSFTLTGAADGVWTFTYRLYADGVDRSLATSIITIGSGSTTSATVSVAAVETGTDRFSASAHVSSFVRVTITARESGSDSFSALCEVTKTPDGIWRIRGLELDIVPQGRW